MNTISNNFENQSKLFAALADETRLEILNVLMNTSNTCVSGLADQLGLSVSAVSQQCKLLEMTGLLRRVRQGQRICYEVRTDNREVKKALSLIK